MKMLLTMQQQLKIFSLVILFNMSCLLLHAQMGEWTWMHGDNVPNTPGVFGTQGVPSPLNHPPPLYEAAEFTDLQGNFWLFGGQDYGFGFYNDLWKYTPSTNQWTWVKGSAMPNATGSSGVQGVPALTNLPSARGFGVTSWVDLNGDFWIYGGVRGSGTGTDLWKYNIATNIWIWMDGWSSVNHPAVYGTKGIPNPNNTPGSRAECNAAWVDNNNNLWLFGGQYLGGYLNDLWKFDLVTNQWTWMSGANFVNQTGNYGIKGIPDTANIPGARWAYCHWKDTSDNLLFFGGKNASGSFNDLWSYNISANLWTWLSGSNLLNDLGNFGTQCISSNSTLPPARNENRCFWTDNNGNFWLYGGILPGLLADLWMFNPVTSEWVFVSGNTVTNQNPIYGTKGIASPLNRPGSRMGAIGWFDGNNSLFLFGGYINSLTSAHTNDLWRYEIDPNCPLIVGTIPTANFSSDTVICQNSCIDFFNLSLNAISYQWIFNGAQTATSTLSHPINICYNNAGNFDVTLISCNNVGCDTIVFPNYIHVDSLPSLYLGVDTSLCMGDSILLDAGGGFTSYLWSDNSTYQSITISSQGTYAVQITSGACNATDTVVVSTQVCTPFISLASTDTNFCEKHCINFYDLSTNNPISWQWFFPGSDSSTSSLQNPTNICYNQYGSFDVTLVACNAAGCDTLYLPGFINEYQTLTPTITQSNDTLFSSPGVAYQWWSVDSGLIAGATNNYFVPTQGGSYYVIITDSNGCNGASNTIIITAIQNPTIDHRPMTIAPNPNKGSFIITLNENIAKDFSIRIINAMGQTVLIKQEAMGNSQKAIVNLPNAVSGLYAVEVITHEKVYRQKFVVATLPK